jgi:methylglutamate dehydrogenase subunit D
MTTMTPVSAFAGLQMPQANGVVIREIDGLGLATVMVRKGQGAALASRVRRSFGIELPHGPRLALAGDIRFIGTGPGAWLAIRENAGNAFSSSLRDAIGDLASVADQSDGVGVVRVSGPKVRDALCKLFAIDLDARAFQSGDAAVTPAGHIATVLWRADDLAGSPVFEIAVHRSFAADFWAHLVEAAAEFG